MTNTLHAARHLDVVLPPGAAYATLDGAYILTRRRRGRRLARGWVLTDAGGRVVGYAYASAWKGRCAYRDVVESTVYVAREAHGRGLGRALMERLLADLAASGFHTVLAGIALPNDASVALHEVLGYHQVGRLEEVGHKLGRRIDVGYWQRRLRGGDR